MRSLERLWKSAGCPAESLQRIDVEGCGPVAARALAAHGADVLQ